MNNSSPNQHQITWDDLAAAATVSRFADSVDRCLLQVAGKDRAVVLLFRESLSGVVDVEFLGAPDDDLLLAIGRIILEHSLACREGRTLV